jgi:hypothetical protein
LIARATNSFAISAFDYSFESESFTSTPNLDDNSFIFA